MSLYLNIITPCARPKNLKKIEQSINIPKNQYRWLVVFDRYFYPYIGFWPFSAELYFLRNKKSKFGNAQRNYALSRVKGGYVYFNDDDTEIHPDLWNNIKEMDADFIYFKQNYKGESRFDEDIRIGNIDSHSFIVKFEIIKDLKWVLDDYAADGIFAIECYKRAKKIRFIDKELSIYNSLRQ